jgi:hypothetical protein
MEAVMNFYETKLLNDLKLADHPRWQASEGQLKLALGVDRRWPDAGLPPTRLGNTTVYVLPRNPAGTRKHRAMAVCAYCGAHVSAGRLHQHLKVHKGPAPFDETDEAYAMPHTG